jgi:hypothetical protein
MESLSETFSRHCVVRYSNTTALIIAGVIGSNLFSRQTFFYQPATQLLQAGPSLHQGRQLHSCAMIDSGHVLVAGGRDYLGGLDSVEILDVRTQVIYKYYEKMKLCFEFKCYFFCLI